MARSKNYIDLTGKTFGKWYVIRRNGSALIRGEPLWLCQCSCDKKTIKNVRGNSLRRGTSSNCGCEKTKDFVERNKLRRKVNEYFIVDNETMGCYSRSKTKDIFYFDKKDYKKIKNYCWWTNDKGYIYTQIDRHTITFHRFIMGLPVVKVDHIDRNPFNNKRNNLRLTNNNRENNQNRSIDHDNTSGFMGVSRTSTKIRGILYWRARITISDDGKTVSKSFEKKEDAIVQRLKWELQYYGIDFAPQRHLFEQYGII